LALDEPRGFHLAHQTAHRRRLDLFGGGQLGDGARTAHQHRQRRELRGADAGLRIGAAQPTQQVDRGRVQAVGQLGGVRLLGSRRGAGCSRGPPMIFVDYLGPPARLDQVREVVSREVARALRVGASQVVVRRLATDADSDEIELWVELSSDEQLYRLGRQLAAGIAAGLRPDGAGPNVWVMYRVVPLSHAFLNGEARARGT